MRKRMMAGALCLFLVAFGVVSGTQAAKRDDDAKFAEHKAKMLEQLDQRIDRALREKNCVQSAADKDEVRACQQKYREDQRQERDADRQERDADRQERQQLKEDRQQERQDKREEQRSRRDEREERVKERVERRDQTTL